MSHQPFDLKPVSSLVRPTSLAWAVAFALATVPLAQAVASAPGSPVGSQIVVAPPGTTSGEYQEIAMDAAGDFVVAWQSFDQAASASEYDVYAQRYASDGVALGS
ncbi:secreted protein, partial [mine drainage metagenome]